MRETIAGGLLAFLLVASLAAVSVTPGSGTGVPPGFSVSNFDPDLNSSLNNQVYDANFIPGFNASLTNTSITWSSGIGYADIGYSIGPWAHDEQGIPHLAVGPQCCNFVEVPHTQQFREPDWGDFYYVRAGFGAPGVNVQNYTSNFKTAADVGLRTDWNWTVQLSLDWNNPSLLDPSNEWAAVGIAATQYVASFPGNLVYTVVNFWMDQNSSSGVPLSSGTPSGVLAGSNVVIYHPTQLSTQGNQTVTINLSPYLQNSLESLGLSPSGPPPVISYVYLNVEGYNFAWNTTLSSFRVMTPNAPSSISPIPYLGAAIVLAVAATSLVYLYRFRRRTPRTQITRTAITATMIDVS